MTDWLKQYKWHAAGGVALVLIISAAFMLLSGKRETSSGFSIPEEASAQTFDKKEEVKHYEEIVPTVNSIEKLFVWTGDSNIFFTIVKNLISFIIIHFIFVAISNFVNNYHQL